MPEELWTVVSNTVQEAVIKTIPKKCKKAKWLSEEALQIAEKRREPKGKGEKERYNHMIHKNEEGTYHHIEILMKEMPGFLSPRRALPLLLIPEYSGINKEQRIPDRSKTAHRKPPVKCFLTEECAYNWLIENAQLR